MKKVAKCTICSQELYSGIGEGCKMCGMLLVEETNKFCCKLCMRKFNTINRGKK
ncbi:hypothetical protein H8D91_00600 [archaeon]|nr:hypothetical protein [archaeon]